MAITDGKYMLLTTFRRDGSPVATPVWVVGLDGGKFGFWTSSGSGKAKRLQHSGRVTVQPCNARGHVTPGSTLVNAEAHLVSGPELDVIRVKVKEKYGFLTKITKFLGLLFGIIKRKPIPYADRGVVVTPLD